MKPEPNTARVTIYNLAEGSRAALEEPGLTLQLAAGYVDTMANIFVGDVENASSRREGTSWVTTIEARDGSRGLRETVINRAWAGDTRLSDVVDHIIAESGLSRGPISGVAGVTLSDGIVVVGSPRKALEKALRGRGLTWSVQNGAVQIHPATDAAQSLVPLLGPSTGLVGSPEVRRETTDAGVATATLTARSLLQPTITAGGRIKIESADRSGVYRVAKLTHVGDTEGGEWYSVVEVDL
jgi:hypothetical protein